MNTANKKKLSRTLIEKADYVENGGVQYPNGSWRRVVIWDTEVKGLGIRLLPSGKRYFIFRYRNKTTGVERLLSLGEFPYMTVKAAREMSLDKIGEVHGGGDPVVERREYFRALNVAELADLYLNEYSKKHKRSWKDDQIRIDLYIKPILGSKKINLLTRRDIVYMRRKIAERSEVVANRTVSLISAIYKYALGEAELLPSGFANPTKELKKLPEESRERYLSEDEAARLLTAVDMEEELWVRLIIRLYFFTAARKNELLKLKWQDVDFEHGRIHFRQTKSGKDHFIRPAPDAMVLLKKLYNQKSPDNPYLFPGQKYGDHQKDIKNQWKRIRKQAGLEDIRLHDLRRSAASWLAQAGVPTTAIQKVLNQSQLAATEVYARMSGDDTAGPLSKLEEIMARVERKAAGGDVIEFPGNKDEE